MDPQLQEYRRKQRERFLAKAEAPVKSVELPLVEASAPKPAPKPAPNSTAGAALAEAEARVAGRLAGGGSATLDAVAKALREGRGEQSILSMLLPDSDEEPEPLQEPPPKRPRPVAPRLSEGAAEALRLRTAPPGRLRLLSWNIDGLDGVSEALEGDLAARVAAACELLCQHAVSVALLQEVVEESLQILRRLLDPHYHIHVGRAGGCPYFCALLLQKKKLRALDSRASFEPFRTSGMGRGLLSIEAATAVEAGPEARLRLCTAHLESCRDGAEERERQFQHSLQHLAAAPAGVTAVLGGDLNLRDEEARRGVRAAQAKRAQAKLPSLRFLDAWEACGSPSAERFTWDPNENDNGSVTGTRGQLPRCRFDRVFVTAPTSASATWQPVSFRLVGRERLASGRFASDHWGVLTELEHQRA